MSQDSNPNNALRNHLGQPVGFPVSDWQQPPPPPKAVMSGRFCRVEPLDAAKHAESLFDANELDTEGRGWTYLPQEPIRDRSAYRSWVEEARRSSDPLFFAIVDSATGRASGIASYLRIDPQSGSVEVGHIHYSPLLQRTPAATEAMYLMMKRAFELGYRRYEWKCDALNQPSRDAAQRLGFSFEGVFRQARVYKGRNRDTAWYSVIDREWPALDAAFQRWLAPENFDAQGRQRVRLTELTRPLLQSIG
jgi:RimJ/RimL family protein N-acetyltransferase